MFITKKIFHNYLHFRRDASKLSQTGLASAQLRRGRQGFPDRRRPRRRPTKLEEQLSAADAAAAAAVIEGREKDGRTAARVFDSCRHDPQSCSSDVGEYFSTFVVGSSKH